MAACRRHGSGRAIHQRRTRTTCSAGTWCRTRRRRKAGARAKRRPLRRARPPVRPPARRASCSPRASISAAISSPTTRRLRTGRTRTRTCRTRSQGFPARSCRTWRPTSTWMRARTRSSACSESSRLCSRSEAPRWASPRRRPARSPRSTHRRRARPPPYRTSPYSSSLQTSTRMRRCSFAWASRSSTGVWDTFSAQPTS